MGKIASTSIVASYQSQQMPWQHEISRRPGKIPGFRLEKSQVDFQNIQDFQSVRHPHTDGQT